MNEARKLAERLRVQARLIDEVGARPEAHVFANTGALFLRQAATTIEALSARVEELEGEATLLRTERDEASFRAAEYWKPIMREQADWIVELIRERDEARETAKNLLAMTTPDGSTLGGRDEQG